jgi:hypothetical protein
MNQPPPHHSFDAATIRVKLLDAIRELSLVREVSAEWILRMKSLSDEDFVFLAESMDESDHSMQEWLLALIEFEYWLRAASRQPDELPVRSQIEYLNCCVQGATQGGGRLLSLQDLFLDYAKTYGVAGR